MIHAGVERAIIVASAMQRGSPANPGESIPARVPWLCAPPFRVVCLFHSDER